MKSKVIYKTDAEKGGTGKADTYKADAEEDGTGRGSEGRGQSNLELSINSDDVHEGRLPLAKVCVGVVSQSLPLTPTMCSLPLAVCPLSAGY